MLEGILGDLVGILAVIGGAALVFRLIASALRVVIWWAHAAAAGAQVERTTRRGDVTGIGESRTAAAAARRKRREAAGATLLWLVWLIAPPAFGLLREGYAIAAPLWLLPTFGSRPPTR